MQAAFDQFYANVNLGGDYRETANKRRDRIVSILEKHFDIRDAFATGSIPRFTAVKTYADLDVLVALHYSKHIKDRAPKDVLQAVRDALAEYRTNVRKNGQAVTLYYETWPNVDIVPAAQLTDTAGAVTGYSIPDMNTGTWITSRPKAHSQNIQDRARACGGHFRRVITMAKWWNRTHSAYLQSYHVEAMAVQIFTGPMNDISWDVFQFFDSAATKARVSLNYEGSYVDGYLSPVTRAEAVARLEKARDIAGEAWYYTYGTNSDHQAAIGRWRVLFGDEFPTYG